MRWLCVTADSGYESEEAYEYLKSQGQILYIKPQSYEKWKREVLWKASVSVNENMAYEEETDTYTCHAGKRLREVFKKKQRNKSGYQSEVTVYECEDCYGCPYKEKSTRAKGNNRLYLYKNFLKKRQESYENILSEKGILYWTNRSIQVDGAFLKYGTNPAICSETRVERRIFNSNERKVPLNHLFWWFCDTPMMTLYKKEEKYCSVNDKNIFKLIYLLFIFICFISTN